MSRDKRDAPLPRDDDPADFGYQRVSAAEKVRRVARVFDSVAWRYDLMNDVMSGGLHRVWKRFAVEQSGLRPGQRALDVAGGTGDLTRLLQRRVGAAGEIVLTDINASMLWRGRDRLADEGVLVPAVQCDAEQLPFADGYFDCVTIGFGLRNVTRKARALKEMTRVLRPGGRLLVLEFSRVWEPLRPLYDVYSFQVLPRLGRAIADDAASYRYLAESIRNHPGQEELKLMMTAAGLERVEYWNLSAGVVALHRGYRL
jgi:demethylmenaquinone methyltransferase / 2-methoxy-6-polyprenyl-1,4-benzoquinol methylase